MSKNYTESEMRLEILRYRSRYSELTLEEEQELIKLESEEIEPEWKEWLKELSDFGESKPQKHYSQQEMELELENFARY